MPLPPLPPSSTPWSSNIHQTYQVLSDIHRNASTALGQSSLNAQRVLFHLTQIAEVALPYLIALASEDNVPEHWILEIGEAFRASLKELIQLQREVAGQERDTSHLKFDHPISIKKHPGRGRPQKVIDPQFLKEAMDTTRRIPLTQLAKKLGVHRNTVMKYLKLNKIARGFTKISNKTLDKLVRSFKSLFPDSGIRYLIGFIRVKGIRVQRRRVELSLRRVDRLGRMIRSRFKSLKKKRLGRYHVSRPHALWHMDGHHKLGPWGIVLHGCVDGFSRTVTGLRASNNNRADTVLEMFLEAVMDYEVPSRVRGDRGGENRDVAILMTLLRGLNRASFMWGSSTFNTRIERLWVEVGSQFARAWKAFFFRLEREHLMDRDNPAHLWLLHYLFLAEINTDCKRFQANWNSHPISGEGHNQTPDAMRFYGALEFGKYNNDWDDCEGMEVGEIEATYGIDPAIEVRGGNKDTEDDDDDEGAPVATAMKSQGMEINHDPVQISKSKIPFSKKQLIMFEALVEEMQEQEIIPAGWGVREEEYEDYIPFETIRSGIKGGGKEICISLPFDLWHPRAVHWAQGFYAMTSVLNCVNLQ